MSAAASGAALETAVPRASVMRGILSRSRKAFEPPPKLTVSEFCDQEIYITSGPRSGTRWRTDYAPYQRGILDAFHERGTEIVVVKGSSQWGKTACAVNVVAYHIAYDPCSILVVEPTVDPMAKEFAKNRLDTVIEASPVLRETVSKKRAKDSSNTTLMKTYRGGALAIGGANSAASLASRPVRLLILDETDRYPPTLSDEGSTIQIALKRTTAFKHRRRVMMLSSPTIEDGTIDAWHKLGDQRRYYVPCPACGHMHPYEWKNVRWQDGDAETARLHCPECEYGIDEAQRVAILARGEWRAEHPLRTDRSIASFHLWEAYSPLSSLARIVAGFLRARQLQKAGDKSEMHTWQNTTLGEAIRPDAGDGIEAHVLIARREEVEIDVDVVEGACCLTMGVDVQDNRLEALVVGWGPGEESWLVDRHVLNGDTSQGEPWDQLDELLALQYRHASGQRLMIQSTCIDSAGHRTTLVYDYAKRMAARRVYAIIGRDGQRPIVSSPSRRRWGRQQLQVPLYTVGVDAAKSLFYSRLKLTSPGPGYVHIPMRDWADEELAAQLTSEQLVQRWKKGVPFTEWRQLRARNEMLDCVVYATAALRILNPKLPQMLEVLLSAGGGVARATAAGKTAAPATTPTQKPTAPKTAPRGRRFTRSTYLR
jgi:phage terminase large subunit GpA-like protein